MPTYKLMYFNFRGRAEYIRWIFAYADIPYTDERFDYYDWSNNKHIVPGGKLPVLMVDDKPLPQSLAISRYIAKEAGLVPEDNLKAAFCDACCDTLYELMVEVYEVLGNVESKSEEEKLREYERELFPKHIEPLLTRFQERLSEKEWLTGDKITWADLMMGVTFAEIEILSPEFLKPFPAVEKFLSKTRSLPNIKAWLDKAPKTQY